MSIAVHVNDTAPYLVTAPISAGQQDVRTAPRRFRQALVLVCMLSLSVTAAQAAPDAAALPSGDAAAGEDAFGTCHICHATTPGTNGVGPSLAGVVGRPSGSVSGYNYSPAMRAAHLTWDPTTLDRYLTNPQAAVHGAKMFVAVPNPTTRSNIIAYLATLK
jgi:cytochrome c